MIDLDHEFDAGSGIVISALTKAQIDNLVTLGKVWDFLKYHYPAVTTGTRHWDFELLRGAARRPGGTDREAGYSVIGDWARCLGPCTAVRFMPHVAG